MKRRSKLFAAILLVCMVITMIPTVAFAADTTVETAQELKEVIQSANGATKITLGADITSEAITISDGKDITLNLGTHKLTSAINLYQGNLTIENGSMIGSNGQAINVYATNSTDSNAYNNLTVKNDAIIQAKYAIILREATKTKVGYGSQIDVYGTLKGNIFVMGNIHNTDNFSVVNVHDGAIIDAESDNIGIALNGAAEMNVGKATITAGTGIEVRAGKLSVNGAEIKGTAQPTSVNPNGSGTTTAGAGIAVAQHTTELPIEVDIAAGEISGYTAFYESNPQENSSDDLNQITLNIANGDFKAINGGTLSVYSEDFTNFISGGYFTSDPSAYVAQDYTVKSSEKPGYLYMVGNGEEEGKTVLPAAGETTATTSDKIAQDNIGTAKTAASSATADLTEAAKTANEEVNVEELATAISSAATDLNAQADDLKLYTQTYLDVTAEEYSAGTGGTAAKLVVDITPKAQVVATTADTAEDIVLTGEGKNAAVVKSAETITVNDKTDVSITLPNGFPTSNLTIKHTKNSGVEYYGYTASNQTITFTTNGFSPFEISAAVAKIGDVGYDTLQAAVNAVQNDQTITLLADKQEAKVANKTISFKVVSDTNKNYTATIKDYTGKELTPGGDNNDTYTVKKVYSGGVVTPPADDTCKKDSTCPISKFTDANPKEWYHDGVHYCIETGLMQGIGNAKFLPNGVLTRAQLAQILYNKAGKPAVSQASTFTDVPATQWYADAIAWAQQNKVVNGIGGNKFAPEEKITREQLAAMLYRSAGSKPVTGTLNFKDAANVSEWAKDAMLWATQNKVINGALQSDGTLLLNAKLGATRAETATMLENYYNK